MAPALCADQAPVLPPSYYRSPAGALHLDALTLSTRLHLLMVCELAVHLAHPPCIPQLPVGRGGARVSIARNRSCCSRSFAPSAAILSGSA